MALFLSRALAGSLFPQFREVQNVTPFILLGILCWAFLASLTKPVIPLYGQAISTIATTAPDAALLFNFKPAKLPELPKGAMAKPYKGGWLLLFQPGVATENAYFLADLLTKKEDK